MKRIFLALFASVLLMGGMHLRAAEYHMGEWIGTWTSGSTTGHFNLALERGANGQVTGNIAVSTDGGPSREFAVDLNQVSLNGDRFTAVFMTPGKNAEVIKLSGVLTSQSGNGQWIASKLGATAQQSQIAGDSATGTWVLQKQES